MDAILAVGIAAVLAGSRSFVAIGEWAADASTDILIGLGVTAGRRPSEATIRRAIRRIDADILDQVIGAYLWLRTGIIGGRRGIAVDGKTVRGARSRTSPAPHLVAALDHDSETVLGQVQTPAESKEIPVLRELLDRFTLEGVVVTADAMHTQRDAAAHIVTAGGDYLLTVKEEPALAAPCVQEPTVGAAARPVRGQHQPRHPGAPHHQGPASAARTGIPAVMPRASASHRSSVLDRPS
ncbi:ISAs1 family transposase [Rathayibacter iranicus NCPPB 2253 = VKM Ac-1602]|nr:ISAs1 family transposase [Rathayibacter iranicus NCPPB 2253 = VKM Ac-1602]